MTPDDPALSGPYTIDTATGSVIGPDGEPISRERLRELAARRALARRKNRK